MDIASQDPFAFEKKHTDLNYETERGFYASMGCAMVGKLWERVLKYRYANREDTFLHTFNGLPFCITTTDALKLRFAKLENKLSELVKRYEAIPEGSSEKAALRKEFSYQCLNNYADIAKVEISEPSLRALSSLVYRDVKPGHEAIVSYRDFLLYPDTKPISAIDDFLGDSYGKSMGVEELVTFYRTNDPLPNVASQYSGFAPYGDISRLMDDLVAYYPRRRLPYSIKAFETAFFLFYVSPFVSNNELLAIMAAKKTLYDAGIGEIALFLPIEKLFEPRVKREDYFLEAIKLGDYTHFHLHCVDRTVAAIDKMLDKMVEISSSSYKEEFLEKEEAEKESKVKEEIIPPPTKVIKLESEEVVPPIEEEEEEEIPEYEEVTFEEVEPEPVRIEPVKPIPVPVKKEPVPVQAPPRDQSAKKAAFEEVPELVDLPTPVAAPTLTNKEIRMNARYILETHPQLNKQQALFFAGHCTPGRFYTVQDYKKASKVAYETARTSMDRLAEAKLYRKYRIKNKYIYTLRQAGEKE